MSKAQLPHSRPYRRRVFPRTDNNRESKAQNIQGASKKLKPMRFLTNVAKISAKKLVLSELRVKTHSAAQRYNILDYYLIFYQ